MGVTMCTVPTPPPIDRQRDRGHAALVRSLDRSIASCRAQIGLLEEARALAVRGDVQSCYDRLLVLSAVLQADHVGDDEAVPQ